MMKPSASAPQTSALPTQGQLIRRPLFYEFILWAASRGREPAFRRFSADLINLQPGEAVLDVGCGTGALAMLAQECVGPTGRVTGIEPAPEMIAFARRKAARRKLPVEFELGVIERLNYPDQSFDVILCSVVLHHMPDETKRQGQHEMARVLKPGGRLLVIDSDLHLLPPFEPHGFQLAQTGPMPILPNYSFAIWRLGAPGQPPAA